MQGLPKIGETFQISSDTDVSFDGFQLWLMRDGAAIGINPVVFQNMINWIDEHIKLRQYMYGVNDDRISGK
jgi:hypothetical protein